MLAGRSLSWYLFFLTTGRGFVPEVTAPIVSAWRQLGTCLEADLLGVHHNLEHRLIHGIDVLSQLLLFLTACLKPRYEAGDLLGAVPSPVPAFWGFHMQGPSAQVKQLSKSLAGLQYGWCVHAPKELVDVSL